MATTIARFRTAHYARRFWALSMALVVVSFLVRTWNMPGVVEALGTSGWDLVIEIVWWSVLIPAAAPVYATVGLLIATRKPRNPIGWLALGLSILISLQDLAWQYSRRANLVDPGQWPGGEIVAWLAGWFSLLLLPPLPFTLMLLYYPAGKLASPRWRWISRLAIFSIVASTAITIIQPSLMDGMPAYADSWKLMPLTTLRVLQLGAQISIVAAALSVVARYRQATGIERQQVKWLAYVSVIVGVSFAGGLIAWMFEDGFYTGSAIFTFAILGMAVGIPITMGIAILKQRLYEIDVIINRTLVYGALTAVLAAVYVSIVFCFQRVLHHVIGPQSSLAIVTSTIAIVALFAPLRNRIQNLIDRRFYRSKYDAEKTLAAFSKRLRSEVDLDRLTAGLMAVVDEAVHPSHVSLWMVKRPERSPSAQKEQG